MGLHDELRHLTETDGAPVVRVERYEAVVLETPETERCVCGRRWPGQQRGERFVAGDRPALGAGDGGVVMEVFGVVRTVEALAVRLVRAVLGAGARHPRFVLWGAVIWLVAGVAS
ncbi:MAG: hypothetical protein ACRD2C_04185 [Acidimicrobiales bacterium]